jgi:hypothetical protein
MNYYTVVLLFFGMHPAAALKLQSGSESGSGPSRWVLGPVKFPSTNFKQDSGTTCDEACAAEGLICNEESRDRQTGLDSRAKMTEAMKAATGNPGFSPCADAPRGYWGSPYVWSNCGTAYFQDIDVGYTPKFQDVPARSRCDANVHGHHQPLCWCVGEEKSGAGGDPHVRNIKGEKFDIHRQGYAPLLSVASDSMAHLEVMALIEMVKKCQKKMFITQVNSSGSWLEKNVAVTVGGLTGQKAFSLMVDGQEVWSPAAQGYKPPSDENIIFKHADKFSISEMTSKATPATQPGVELKTAHHVNLKIVRPLRRPTSPPHLNFDIQGLNKLPLSFKIGGLLGNDDHSHWTTRDENCGVQFAGQQGDEGSEASAH